MQINTAYNGDLVLGLDAALELGWCVNGKLEEVGLADGQLSSGLATEGSLIWFGQTKIVSVLVIELEVLFGIQGYIGMGLLKGSRIDFGYSEFHVSALEG